MNEKCLIIGIPYIKNAENERVKLCADITFDDKCKTMFFEVDKEYKEYLCTELSDAFITGIFYFASYNQFNIKCLGPASERLIYQLNQYYLPTIHKMDSEHYKMIKVEAQDLVNIEFDTNYAVGTAASGGVDSFYSILSHHRNNRYEDYNLTHVIVANLFNKYDEEENVRKKYDILLEKAETISTELNLPIIKMYTNHHEFLFRDYVEFYSLRICSYAFALQKLFKVYLISSGTMFQDSNFKSTDSTDYDVFNTPMASTNNLTFYMSGGEKGRVEKIEYISKYDVVKKNLHVCTLNDKKNCSECDKCMRTMVALDLVGDLQEYKSIFDLSKYAKRKNMYLGKVISQAKDNVYGVLNTELIQEAKKRRYKIPNISYIYAWVLWTPYIFIKDLLKKSALIKKIYFKLKIDYLIYGKEKAEIYRFGK